MTAEILSFPGQQAPAEDNDLIFSCKVCHNLQWHLAESGSIQCAKCGGYDVDICWGMTDKPEETA